MSNDKIENEEETKGQEKRDIKDDDELQDELKEWEVESTEAGD